MSIRKSLSVFAAVAAAILALGCGPAGGGDDGTTLVYLGASFEGEALGTEARSTRIGPALPDIATFRLLGAKSGGELEELASFDAISGAEATLERGTWDFVLDAEGEEGELLLSGSLEGAVLGAEPATLAFVLEPAAEGTGSVAVMINWPGDLTVPVEGVEASFVDRSTGAELETEAPTVSGTEALFSASGLPAGDYNLLVSFLDAAGEELTSYSAVVAVAPRLASTASIELEAGFFNAVPEAPSSLELSWADGAVSIAWTDESVNEKGFLVERRAEGTEEWTTIADSLAAGTERIDDATVERGASYEYRVCAYNRFGDSAYVEGSIEIPCILSFDNGPGSATASIEAAAGTSVLLPSAAPTLAGCRFQGWYEDGDSEGFVYWPGRSYKLAAAEATLRAKWAAVLAIEVEVDLGGAELSLEGDGTVAKGTVIEFAVDGEFASYRWLLDGSLLAGEEGPGLELDTATREAKVYELAVFVEDEDGEVSSAHCYFSITN